MDFRVWLENKKEGKSGAGILPLADASGRILLGKRSQSIDHPGKWAIFGGIMEEGESPKEAAKREMEEETQYKGEMKIKPLAVTEKNGFKFHSFLGTIPKEFEPKLNYETAKYKWFTLQEAQELKNKIEGLEDLIKIVA